MRQGAAADWPISDQVPERCLERLLHPLKRDTMRRFEKVVDKFNEWFVSAFVTASRFRFVLLHTAKNDEGIRLFFQAGIQSLSFHTFHYYIYQEMYEPYINLSMIPFYAADSPIQSTSFDQKATLYGRKYLV